MHASLHSVPPTLWQATADPHLCCRLLYTHGQVWVSLLLGSLLLSPGFWYAQGFVCAVQESVSSVLCTFWRLYSGVNGDLLQEGLCHSHLYCTQSPCPCSRPLLTCSSTVDIKTQFWLSLCGVSGSQFAQSLFEPPSVPGSYGV